MTKIIQDVLFELGYIIGRTLLQASVIAFFAGLLWLAHYIWHNPFSLLWLAVVGFIYNCIVSYYRLYRDYGNK